MNVAWDPERSLFPERDGGHPFFWSTLEGELQLLRARVQRVFASPLPPESLKSLRAWFRTQHVFHSNAIEGSTLTLYETQVVIGDGLTVGGKPLRDVLAARNLAHALDWVEEHARSPVALSERFVKELHALALRHDDAVLPGTYKQENNRVAGARFRTPSAVQTPSLMEAFGRFLAGSMEPDAVLSSAIAHAWLVGIHPFRDGNGRTARLLSNVVLLARNYPVALLQVERRPEYYATLDEAHCTGDLTNFVRLWCDCVSATLDEYERIGGTMQVREREVQYFAQAINQQKAPPDLELEQWRVAIEGLGSEMATIAQKLNAKLQGGRVEVETSAVGTEELLKARSNHGPVMLVVSGTLPERLFRAGLSWECRPADRRLFLTPYGWNSGPYGLRELRLEGGRFRVLSGEGEEVATTAEAANVLMREILVNAAGLAAPPTTAVAR